MSDVNLTLHDVARALGGEVSGEQVVAPAPGHNAYDRSLAVKLCPGPLGFMVHSFAGEDWRELRDYVLDCIGLEPGEIRSQAPRPSPTNAQRIEWARKIWTEGVEPRGTVVERYLSNRAIRLPEVTANRVIRFHPECPWRDKETGRTFRVPAMLAGMGSLETRELTAVHRTRLSPVGLKLDRRMLGVAGGSAIPLESLGFGRELVIGEGIETCLSGSQLGFRPVWALASATAIARFPVLDGIETLTILAEMDIASEVAVEACRQRWASAGRKVIVMLPLAGKDMNDALRELIA